MRAAFVAATDAVFVDFDQRATVLAPNFDRQTAALEHSLRNFGGLLW